MRAEYKLKIYLKFLFIILMIALLSSCSLLSPLKADYTTYVFNTLPCKVKYSPANITLFVATVSADPLYETDDIAYSSHPLQVEYFAKNKWADTPARMLRPLIINTLQGTRHFRVITTSQNTQYDYILSAKIEELQQVFTAHSSYVVFRLHVEIINPKTGRIVRAREFISSKITCQCTPYSGVVAANRAITQVLAELANFTNKIY
jgi:cholesterol transport system auxiliary component